MRSLLVCLPLLLIGCYNPAPQSGVQQCGPKGECPDGYTCGADKHCYKGVLPKLDMAVAMPDMAACTVDSCKNGPKPVCDPMSHACVDCLQDGDCPPGKICQQKACVDGCTDQHPCPSGMCVNGKCSVCKGDGDCAPPTAKCDVGSGKCVACLTTGDCKPGEFCDPNDHACHQGCDDDGQCKPTSDGGVQVMKCCNHACYDVNSAQAHCGDCGTDCQGTACCGGTCSDTTNDIANCGGCGLGCAGQHAVWKCAQSMCAVMSCNPGYDDCNMMPNDGCEVVLNSDVNNCGVCKNRCMANNAMASCVAGKCMVGACNMGFTDCNMQPNDGCEINTGGDPVNCGTCGKVCSPQNATPACVGGMCSFGACTMGFSNCDGNQANGCETSTAADPNNCGGCGMKCAGLPNVMTVTCANSMCAIGACVAGFGNCDGIVANGCEKNLTNDVMNCGMCGKTCPNTANVATTKCSGSACAVSTCNGGFADCNGQYADGCEKNLTNDPANCGVCGKLCMNGQVCVNSMCVAVQGIKVAILGGGFYVDQPRAFLAGQPMITSATRIDACDLGTLGAYNVVVVHGNGTCFDGNAFTTYVQNGGGIIGTPWVFANNGGFAALPVSLTANQGANHSIALSVNVTDVNDVLLQGVAFANGNLVGYEKGTFALRNGATNSVIWNADPAQLAVAKWSFGNGRAVYLDFQYLTSDTAAALGGGNPNVGPYPWAQTLLYNSVLWAGKLK